MGKKFGISFSPSRLIGLSSAKQKNRSQDWNISY